MKIRAEQYTAAYWRVTIDNPPINIFDRETADELHSLLTKLEIDEAVKVVVFESANPHSFIAPAEFADAAAGFDEQLTPAVREALHSFLERIGRSRFLTVGVLRGRARGAGSEFLLALDVRFASREKGRLSQIDLGTEYADETDAFERLCVLVGRARALEIILGSEDLDADTAERLNLINRSIPDENLDEFIDRFAASISNFDREYIAAVKRTTGDPSNAAAVDAFSPARLEFGAVSEWSERQERVATPFERSLHDRGDRELILGEELRPDWGS